jgi:hypothetical protein
MNKGKANRRARVFLAVCARLVRRPIVHCLILGFSRLFTFLSQLCSWPPLHFLSAAAVVVPRAAVAHAPLLLAAARAPAACCRTLPCRLLPRARLLPAAARAVLLCLLPRAPSSAAAAHAMSWSRGRGGSEEIHGRGRGGSDWIYGAGRGSSDEVHSAGGGSCDSDEVHVGGRGGRDWIYGGGEWAAAGSMVEEGKVRRDPWSGVVELAATVSTAEGEGVPTGSIFAVRRQHPVVKQAGLKFHCAKVVSRHLVALSIQ